MKKLIDWDHYYWRFAERWNGRLAMIGCIGIFTYILCK